VKNKILIADDDRDTVDCIKMVLESSGYEVSTVNDCSKIIELLYFIKPDLLLLDRWMGGKDATEICREIKKSNTIPVILVSGTYDLAQLTINAGADDFLSKPFDMSALTEKVSSHIYASIRG
jgi:two-component system response regulator VicR